MVSPPPADPDARLAADADVWRDATSSAAAEISTTSGPLARGASPQGGTEDSQHCAYHSESPHGSSCIVPEAAECSPGPIAAASLIEWGTDG